MIFTHPAFLWGLLAVAIPIVIHLFNFRRYRKVYFSNVDRLSELHTEQKRRSTLHQWLVLAMRILAVVFLVLAFAHPVIPTNSDTVRKGSTAVSIYIDNSFSMEGASSDGTQLDAARQKAREVVEAYSVSDRFQLLSNDMKGTEMRWLNRDEFLEALDELELSPAAPLMSSVAKRQHDMLRNAGAHNSHAYIISDFQRSTADLEALPATDNFPIQCTLVPLTAVASDNLFVDSLILDAPAYFVGGSVAVEVLLSNSGSRDAEKVPVKLTVDGRERAVTTADIAAGTTTRATLVFRLDHAGWSTGCVTIEDYPVTFDDNYWFSLFVGDRIRVLHIGERRMDSPVERLFAGDSTIAYQQATRLQHDLSQYDFVVLDEVQTLASGEVQQLTQWVLDGGNLLVIPQAASGQQAMGGLNDLLTALQAPRMEQWGQQTVKASAVDFESSLYRGVFNGRSDEMEMPTVQGYYTLAGQSIKQSIITLSNGGDLLCVTPAGEGRLYLFTTPLTQTDFASQALFVPTLYNMALYSRPMPQPAYTLGDDEPIILQETYDPSHPPTLSALQTPNSELRTSNSPNSFLPDIRRAGGRQQLILHGELTNDGIYSLGGEHYATTEEIAFNYPRRESRMEFMDRREIAKAIDGRDDITMVRNSSKPITEELRARDGGHQLWKLCVLLALLALAAETALLLAHRRHNR